MLSSTVLCLVATLMASPCLGYRHVTGYGGDLIEDAGYGMEFAIEAPEAGSTYGYGLKYHLEAPDNLVETPKERGADFDIHGGYHDDHGVHYDDDHDVNRYQ